MRESMKAEGGERRQDQGEAERVEGDGSIVHVVR